MKMKSIIICFCFCCLGSWGHMLSAQEQVRALCPLEQCILVTDLADRIEEIQVIPIKQCFDAESLEWMRKKLLIGPAEHQPAHGNLLHPRPDQRNTLSPEIKTEIITFQGSEYLRESP